jgi:hypothetical protein
MSDTFLAEFDTPAVLAGVLRDVREAGHHPLDAFTPFPVSEVEAEFDHTPSRIRLVMLVVGVLVGALAYFIQWWTAAFAYPLNVGSRPLNSWPVFLLAPFEIGVLAAAVAGIIAFCNDCGLPRLHHALFEVPGFERATDDRFFLLIRSARSDENGLALRHLLESSGALLVTELRDT